MSTVLETNPKFSHVALDATAYSTPELQRREVISGINNLLTNLRRNLREIPEFLAACNKKYSSEIPVGGPIVPRKRLPLDVSFTKSGYDYSVKFSRVPNEDDVVESLDVIKKDPTGKKIVELKLSSTNTVGENQELVDGSIFLDAPGMSVPLQNSRDALTAATDVVKNFFE